MANPQWHWGTIPDSPPTLEERNALIAEEKRVLQKVQQAQKGYCAACGFPAMAALRGHKQDGRWFGVCPVCRAGLNLAFAPEEAQMVFMPETPQVKINQTLHTIYAWMHSADRNQLDTADIVFDLINDRSMYTESILGVRQLTPGGLLAQVWDMSPTERQGAQRLLQHLRLILFPEAIASAVDYWHKTVYPRWQPIQRKPS
ncbi:MAG: hypothetical protein CVV05_00715 [Gammaproteobacteria bacterium HGW-Gammaproteobacteria-1]|nr:MAG: hypothetical protein CVV05_00715 [Gammaproteobacteria bacterium HGW-Gammaproteobacteria-1]